MNVLTIAGNLGREARLNSIQGQQGPVSVLNFAVAVKKRQKGDDGKPLTLWVDCSLWGARADALAQYLQKGTRVSVTGEADVTTYQDGAGNTVPKLTLRVNDITMLGGGEQQQQQQGGYGAGPAYQAQGAAPQQQRPAQQPQAGGYQQPAARKAQAPAGPENQFDDDIPF